MFFVILKQKLIRFCLTVLNSLAHKLLIFFPLWRNASLDLPENIKQKRVQVTQELDSIFKNYTQTCATCFSVNEHCCYSTDGVLSYVDTMANEAPLGRGWNTQNSLLFAVSQSFSFVLKGSCMVHNGNPCEYLTEKGCGLSPYQKPMGCLVAICPKIEKVISRDDVKKLGAMTTRYFCITVQAYLLMFRTVIFTVPKTTLEDI